MTRTQEPGVSDARSGSDGRVHRVYTALRALIVSGRLAPGTRIVESEVADRLQVSRTPVRSALQRLTDEGFVMVARPSGKQQRLSVSPLTREDAREILGILGEAEALGARWAAELPEPGRSRLARQLRELNDTLAERARRDPVEPDEIFELHRRFHDHFMAAVHAPRLSALHQSITLQAERYRRIYSNLFARDSQVSVDEHRPIIESIDRGDGDAAQRAVQLNWRNAAERLMRSIELHGERGSW
jgi:DNA-binding GntR family transcriptional regulator